MKKITQIFVSFLLSAFTFVSLGLSAQASSVIPSPTPSATDTNLVIPQGNVAIDSLIPTAQLCTDSYYSYLFYGTGSALGLQFIGSFPGMEVVGTPSQAGNATIQYQCAGPGGYSDYSPVMHNINVQVKSSAPSKKPHPKHKKHDPKNHKKPNPNKNKRKIVRKFLHSLKLKK